MKKELLALVITTVLIAVGLSGCTDETAVEENGALEVEVKDENDGFVSNAEVWLWTEESFGGNPDWIEYTNETGKILFRDLDVGEYVVSLSVIKYFTNDEEALANIKHVTIKVNEVTYEVLKIPNSTATGLSADFILFIYNTSRKELDVTLKNTGDTTINELTLNITIPGSSLSSHGWSGPIEIDQTVTLNLTAGPEYAAGEYVLNYELRYRVGDEVVASATGEEEITIVVQ